MQPKVEIDFIKYNSISAIENAYTNEESNNVSKSSLPLNTESVGYDGFQFAEVYGEWPTLADGTHKYFPDEGYPGYMSSKLSAANGDIDFSLIVKPVINLFGGLRYIVIIFDKICNEFAKRLEVGCSDNSFQMVINNKSYVCVIKLPKIVKNPNFVNIKITKWNKPFKSVKITGISTSLKCVFSNSEVATFDCSEQSWDAQFNLTTGVMQQYADITFRDVYGILHALSDVDALQELLPIKISVIDENESEKLLGYYTTDTWSCSGIDDKVTLSCNDLTRNFEDTIITVIEQKISVFDLFAKLNTLVPSEITFVIVDDKIDYLKTCICEDVYFQSVTLSSILSEICDRWMLRIYWHPQEQKYVVMEAW